MGGDGGTLNNSRAEHARLRKEVLGAQSAIATQRASVTQCAISGDALRPPHVVVDRIGQLYNKDALISFLLERRAKPHVASDAFSHIRSLKKDTAPVRFVCSVNALMCPVTRKEVSPDGRFTVGWACGCVTAPVRGVRGVRDSDEKDHEGAEGSCINCAVKGRRVRLGLSLAERIEAREQLERLRANRSTKKRRLSKEKSLPSKVRKVASEGKA